jgi:hypothetical protein
VLIHIVCWKYRDDVNEAARGHHRERLASLQGLVPGLRRLDIGEDVLHLDRSFDTALVAEFEDMESLDDYTVHPDHQVVVAVGREIADKVMSVDFYRSE